MKIILYMYFDSLLNFPLFPQFFFLHHFLFFNIFSWRRITYHLRSKGKSWILLGVGSPIKLSVGTKQLFSVQRELPATVMLCMWVYTSSCCSLSISTFRAKPLEKVLALRAVQHVICFCPIRYCPILAWRGKLKNKCPGQVVQLEHHHGHRKVVDSIPSHGTTNRCLSLSPFPSKINQQGDHWVKIKKIIMKNKHFS